MKKTKYNKTTGVPILKYNTEIGLTSELSNLIKNGLKTYSEINNLVCLSDENNIVIKRTIKKDDSYRFELSKIVFKSFIAQNAFDRKRDSYFAILRMIDIDNSTQLWRFRNQNNYALLKVVNYILKNERNFYNRLNDGDLTLVNDLVRAAKGWDILSFASKVCKYLNEWIFGKDDYFIYDFYVVNILPYYLEYYSSNFKSEFDNFDLNLKDYKTRDYLKFYKLMDGIMKLRNKEYNSKMSKKDLDHIMWYSYHKFSKN